MESCAEVALQDKFLLWLGRAGLPQSATSGPVVEKKLRCFSRPWRPTSEAHLDSRMWRKIDNRDWTAAMTERRRRDNPDKTGG